ncbi:MAG: sulfite reductase [NADPH] flavoprotein alpha-component [Xanthomonadales bacterium]|nr:sulfite reductase [NADPH] flavoprotein alpha-component [Xanthomonadales bacterium]
MFSALQADNSPFSQAQIESLQQSLGELDGFQSAWLSGFIAGRLASPALSFAPTQNAAALALPVAGVTAANSVSARANGQRLQVFFASQTGNGESVALALAAEAERAGVAVEVRSLAELRPAALKKLRYAAFVISTHGEGDPPDDALELFEYLKGSRAAPLGQLNFQVLALGDRSYSKFCAAGRELENLLLAQGASRFAERIECDVDFQALASAWSTEVLRFAQDTFAPASGESRVSQAVSASSAHLSIVPQVNRWTRANPFAATVERVQKITGLESAKNVFHLELSLEGSGLEYAPGDALGVWAPNAHELVNEVLDALDIAADDEVILDSHRHTIDAVLTRKRELTRLSADTVRGYAELAGNRELQDHFEQLDEKQRREFIEQRQFADLLAQYPVAAGCRISADSLAALLRPLASRSYSIASSQASVDDQVHLTVASLSTLAGGRERHGVASNFLNRHIAPGDEVHVFPEPNRRFRLPEDRDTPLILIAAGTGVAPYRAFLQQLAAEGSAPPAWLIFGNPHLRTDFLYQREWLEFRQRGLLTHIDGAFSRDQKEKRYVQHVLQEQGARLDQWLGRGAQIYICGGLDMGREVELALRDALCEQRKVDTATAAELVADLRRQGRLLKDLY